MRLIEFIGRVNSLSLMHLLRVETHEAAVGSLISFVTWLKAVVMIDNNQQIPSSIGCSGHDYLSGNSLSMHSLSLAGVMQTEWLQLSCY